MVGVGMQDGGNKWVRNVSGEGRKDGLKQGNNEGSVTGKRRSSGIPKEG